ncbi:MAG: hypothetical protein K6G89_01145 [Clostridia bacterium]|nr:hypothetical protein [Clostridia bacterium]
MNNASITIDAIEAITENAIISVRSIEYTTFILIVPLREWLSGNCFLLKARGNSMTSVGIDDGDLVLVRREHGSPEEYNGKVIVALTETGNTLKRLFMENGRPRLHPKNRRYKDIYPERLEMQGVAVRVIKEVE